MTTEKTVTKKTFVEGHKHLFAKRSQKYSIGNGIRRVKDLSRYVRWPRYVRLQRQRAILLKRLKAPPSVNHIVSKALTAQQASSVFGLLKKYRPESKKEKKVRITERAQKLQEGKEISESKPYFLKFGLNHVTNLIEEKKAKLVVLAHDVDPIELIAWVPALCRAMDVPYVIVKGKAKLGALVHQKTAAVVALTDVKKEDMATLDQITKNFNGQFKDLPVSERRKWGQIVLGPKASAKLAKIQRAKAKEATFSQ